MHYQVSEKDLVHAMKLPMCKVLVRQVSQHLWDAAAICPKCVNLMPSLIVWVCQEYVILTKFRNDKRIVQALEFDDGIRGSEREAPHLYHELVAGIDLQAQRMIWHEVATAHDAPRLTCDAPSSPHRFMN
jgi:hypothetical protein